MLFWGSAFFAILLMFLLWHAEMMKAQATAISIRIILAHTMFLSGIVLGFRFYLIGALLFCTAGLTILMHAIIKISAILQKKHCPKKASGTLLSVPFHNLLPKLWFFRIKAIPIRLANNYRAGYINTIQQIR
jgi:hypothetical protein